jgi:hypothetical protein
MQHQKAFYVRRFVQTSLPLLQTQMPRHVTRYIQRSRGSR